MPKKFNVGERYWVRIDDNRMKHKNFEIEITEVKKDPTVYGLGSMITFTYLMSNKRCNKWEQNLIDMIEEYIRWSSNNVYEGISKRLEEEWEQC